MKGRLALAPPALLLTVGLVSACSANLNRPTCGWTTNVPSHPAAVCSSVYDTLRVVAAAEAEGRDNVIEKIVRPPAVAERIIGFGRLLRRSHLKFLRVSPSLLLSAEPHDQVLAGLQLVGKDDQGTIGNPETVTVQLHGHTGTIIGDQPQQDW